MIPGRTFAILISPPVVPHPMEFRQAVSQRRSEYSLDGNIDIPRSVITDMVSELAMTLPSPFNVQSHRALILFDGDHDDLWHIVRASLVEKIGEERFKASRARVDSFSAAAGTILFFIDDASVRGLCDRQPSYADMFPVWAEQSCGMFQYAVWTGLRDLGLGANIQHYNPLIDDRVGERFGVPGDYRLVSQMPFGRIVDPAPPRGSLPEDVLTAVSHW